MQHVKTDSRNACQTFYNSEKQQVVSEVTLSREKQLLFKCTVKNRKCFVHYLISTKIIKFNL